MTSAVLNHYTTAQALLGDTKALAILRHKEVSFAKNSNQITGMKRDEKITIPKFQIDSITKEGTTIVRVGSQSIRDEGDRIKISHTLSKEELKTALQLAQQRFGSCIKVEGSALFKKAVLQAACHFKLNITFDDSHLEMQHQKLINSINQEKSHEQRRPLPLRSRTTISRNDETPRANLTGTNPTRGGRAGIIPFSPINKPHLSRIGRCPPPESKNGLRNLSKLRMVQFTKRSEMLLPSHVHGQLERQRTEFDNPMRRDVSRAGVKVNNVIKIQPKANKKRKK